MVPEFFALREEAGGVLFRTVAGASRRRNASRDLSSTSHSRELHGLGDGGGEVDVPLLAGFAFDELNFGGETHG